MGYLLVEEENIYQFTDSKVDGQREREQGGQETPSLVLTFSTWKCWSFKVSDGHTDRPAPAVCCVRRSRRRCSRLSSAQTSRRCHSRVIPSSCAILPSETVEELPDELGVEGVVELDGH